MVRTIFYCLHLHLIAGLETVGCFLNISVISEHVKVLIGHVSVVIAIFSLLGTT